MLGLFEDALTLATNKWVLLLLTVLIGIVSEVVFAISFGALNDGSRYLPLFGLQVVTAAFAVLVGWFNSWINDF